MRPTPLARMSWSRAVLLLSLSLTVALVAGGTLFNFFLKIILILILILILLSASSLGLSRKALFWHE